MIIDRLTLKKRCIAKLNLIPLHIEKSIFNGVNFQNI